MDANSDLKFVIGALVVLGFLWIASGGPSNTTSRGPILRGPNGSEQISEHDQTGNNFDRVEEDLDTIEKELEKAQSRFEASPYQGDIDIDSFSRAKKRTADEEYIKMEVSRKAPANINISGWRLESPLTGVSVSIGKGAYLPYSARVNPEEAIFVRPGEEIYIVTGRSPIGVSFRTNICTGYFEQFQDFEPSLPKQCPEPIDDLFRLVDISGSVQDDMCVEFVEDLNRCEIFLSSAPPSLPSSCQAYIKEKVNYNTCVDLHKSDRDFQGNEWRVYLGRTDEIWKERREIIKLLDENGKTVDVVTY